MAYTRIPGRHDGYRSQLYTATAGRGPCVDTYAVRAPVPFVMAPTGSPQVPPVVGEGLEPGDVIPEPFTPVNDRLPLLAHAAPMAVTAPRQAHYPDRVVLVSLPYFVALSPQSQYHDWNAFAIDVLPRYCIAYFADMDISNLKVLSGDPLRRNLSLERLVASRVMEVRALLERKQGNVLTRLWRRVTGAPPQYAASRHLAQYLNGLPLPRILRGYGGPRSTYYGIVNGGRTGRTALDRLDLLPSDAQLQLRERVDALEDRIIQGLTKPPWHQ